MLRIFGKSFVAAVALLTLVLTNSGQAQDTGKRIGERLDDAGREVRSGLNRAGQGAKEQFASAKTSVQNMGVESRVYGRLHWDKALNDAAIELSASETGVITLNGSVASLQAKAHAVTLTRDTVGVTEVVDRLAVRSPSATIEKAATQP